MSTSSNFSSWFIINNTRPGSIIILHDGKTRGEYTVKTLDKIIPKLQEKGFEFVTLSELVKNNN